MTCSLDIKTTQSRFKKPWARQAVSVYIKDRGFNGFASNMIKLSVNESNGVVCQPGFALLFFIFRFENLIPGPMAGYRGKTFPCVHEELNTLKSENTKSSRHASLQKRRHVFYYSVLKCDLRAKLRQMIKTLTETECLLKLERPRFTFTANGKRQI